MSGKHFSEPQETESAPRRAPKKTPPRRSLLQLLLGDILLAALFLCLFALFHHVLPRLTVTEADVPVPKAVSTPAPTETAAPEELTLPAETPGAGEDVPPEDTPEPTPTPDPRTPWQIKFAEHFTDEVVVTDNSYSSPNISITIEKHVDNEEHPKLVWFVADIYVARIENFQTYLANGEFEYYASEDPVDMDLHSGAILAINGDYCNRYTEGLFVRNGLLYMDEPTRYDICVLYYDGTMETYEPSEYSVEDILARNPYQIWKFGPELLNDDGTAKTVFNSPLSKTNLHPRTAIGYYEPGHYCFVVIDGRQNGYSVGTNIRGVADIMAELGCTCAYNLDGGASTTMTFNDALYNIPCGDRDLGDILLIREIDEPAAETGEEDG